MKAAWRKIALLTSASLLAIGLSERSSDDLVTLGELRRLRRAGAL